MLAAKSEGLADAAKDSRRFGRRGTRPDRIGCVVIGDEGVSGTLTWFEDPRSGSEPAGSCGGSDEDMTPGSGQIPDSGKMGINRAEDEANRCTASALGDIPMKRSLAWTKSQRPGVGSWTAR